MVSFDQKPEYLHFANAILDVRFLPGECVWITSLIDGKIAGVTVFNRISKWNCEITTASVDPRWITRAYLRAVFRYPFIQCGMSSVYSVVEDDNRTALDFNIRVGFDPKTILPDWFGKQDGILMYMKRNECRWINEERTVRTNLVHAA